MRLTLLWPLLLSTACPAQRSATPAPEPNGIVTGRVFCGDTGRPARFASVSLKPVDDPQGQKSPPIGTTITTAVDTTLDGSYTLTHIAPGSYYVIVRMNGYISPLAMFSTRQLEHPTGQIRALIDQAVPRVTVEQDSTAHADIQIQRGASVSGTITYDDGSPAEGITLSLLHKDEGGRWVPLNGRGPIPPTFVTDDRGDYRLSALLPDTYLLEASLHLGTEKTSVVRDGAGRTSEAMMRNFKFSLSFYGDGTPYMDQAGSFTLHGDDERTGQDMILPISKLHRLTGRVAAGPGGHPVNAASVELISATDSGKKSLAHSDIDREDGLFHFDFVPQGDYTLKVTNARDVAWEPADASSPGAMPQPPGFPRPDKERILQTYGNVEMPLLIRGDMLDVIATVKPQETKTAGTN